MDIFLMYLINIPNIVSIPNCLLKVLHKTVLIFLRLFDIFKWKKRITRKFLKNFTYKTGICFTQWIWDIFLRNILVHNLKTELCTRLFKCSNIRLLLIYLHPRLQAQWNDRECKKNYVDFYSFVTIEYYKD